MFLVYKNYGEVLSKLNSRGFCATSLSTYDFQLFIQPYYNSVRFTGKRSKRNRFVSSISIILSTLHIVSHGYIVGNVIRWFTIKPALK